MAGEDDQRPTKEGVALTGTVVYDQELYGDQPNSFAGYSQSLGVGQDDEQDEREQALSKCAAIHAAHIAL